MLKIQRETNYALFFLIMRQVAVIGAGKTPFGAFPDKDLRTLAVEAAHKSLANAQVDTGAIEAF